jgi:HEAT repeat protein
MKAFIRICLSLMALLVLPATRCLALGTEEFGNKPLSALNYPNWKGIIDVVNDKSRVYQRWVNGNEHMFYEGGIDDLNRVLKNFAAAEMPVHEVVLRPDPGVTHSFDNTKPPIKFNWQLHVVTGIAGSLTNSDKGDFVWPKHPRLTIHTSGDFDLSKLMVPKGVKLASIEEQSAVARLAMDSTDQSVRGWSAGVVAELDHHDPANLAALERLLADDNDWVRLNAAGSIGLFGRQAKSSIPALKKCLDRPDENLKSAAKTAIETIEAAPDRTEEAKARAGGLKKIKDFIAEHKPTP